MGGQSLANRCSSGIRVYQNFMGSLRSEILWGMVICAKDIGHISIIFTLDGLWSNSAVLYIICTRWFPRLNLKITELLMPFKYALMAWMWMSIFNITTNNLGLHRKNMVNYCPHCIMFISVQTWFIVIWVICCYDRGGGGGKWVSRKRMCILVSMT